MYGNLEDAALQQAARLMREALEILDASPEEGLAACHLQMALDQLEARIESTAPFEPELVFSGAR
jgi:hypothetical protein